VISWKRSNWFFLTPHAEPNYIRSQIAVSIDSDGVIDTLRLTEACLLSPLQLQSTIIKWCTKNAGWISMGSLENSRRFSAPSMRGYSRFTGQSSRPNQVVRNWRFDWGFVGLSVLIALVAGSWYVASRHKETLFLTQWAAQGPLIQLQHNPFRKPIPSQQLRNTARTLCTSEAPCKNFNQIVADGGISTT